MSPQARAQATQQAAAHPPYKLFLQKIDLPTILVVPQSTTDDQLKNLLWYLRTEVRNAHFKQLHIAPTSSTFGAPNYLSGNLTIYRTSQCASEMHTTALPGPCGDKSSHNSAAYHWGEDGNPAHDQADLFSADRKLTALFDSTDGFQTDTEAAADPTGTKARAIEARVRYAIAQTAKQSRQHSDIRFFPDILVGEFTTQLDAVSYQFATEEARQRFARDLTTLESDRLCALGFQAIALGTQYNQVQRTFIIPCPTSAKTQKVHP